MAFEDCTKEYVDIITHNKYASLTSDNASFEAIKNVYDVYLCTNTGFLPDVKYTHALALLVAHYYAMGSIINPSGEDDGGGSGGGNDTGEIGAVISQKVGDVEVRYADTNSSSNSSNSGSGGGSGEYDRTAWLKLTVYGKEYLKLMRSFRSAAFVL